VPVVLSGYLLALTLGAGAAGSATVDGRSVLLGNDTVAQALGSEPAGRALAFGLQAHRSGLARAFHVFVEKSNRASLITAALYTARRGRPALLLRAASIRHPRLGEWNVVAIAPLHIHGGARYWLAILGQRGRLAYRDRDGRCASVQSAGRHLRHLPHRWSSGRARSSCAVSAYVSGTGLGPPATTRPGGGPSGTTTTTTGPTTSPPPPRSSNCFAAPGACGYPDPSYGTVGPSVPCSSLRPTGSMTVSNAGATISNLNIIGSLTVTAPNVHVTNVCVTTNGGGVQGSIAVSSRDGGTNLTIDHSTIAGANASGQSVQIAAANLSGGPGTLSHDYIHNCGECVHDGPWTVNDSYVISDGAVQGDHFEDLYCSDESESLSHDTLLNPNDQTAVIFCDTNGGGGGACDNHISVANSLLAGGDEIIYSCGNASSVGTSTLSFTTNRVARCKTRSVQDRSTGGWVCTGGADSFGYWPNGGYFDVDAHQYTYCPPIARQRWSGNVWDDNGAGVSC
jgi:hypothetical protein